MFKVNNKNTHTLSVAGSFKYVRSFSGHQQLNDQLKLIGIS